MAQATQERTVRHIPATNPGPAVGGNRRHGRQRVAAYCRVSTDSEEQINSYTAQKAYYTQKIEETPDWEMAGLFAEATDIIRTKQNPTKREPLLS